MKDDPLWHRIQAGLAVHSLLDWAGHDNAGRFRDHVIVHLRNAMNHGWTELEQDLLRRLT